MPNQLCFVSPDHRMFTSHSLHYDSWVRNWRQTACNWHELWAGCTLRCIRMIRFGPKLGQIGPKRVKSGTFSDLNEPKYTEICPEKVTDLSRLGPIWPTFGPNPISSLRCILFFIQSRQHKPIIDTCTLHYYHCYTPAYTLYNFTYLNWSRGGEVSAFHCISIMIGF